MISFSQFLIENAVKTVRPKTKYRPHEEYYKTPVHDIGSHEVEVWSKIHHQILPSGKVEKHHEMSWGMTHKKTGNFTYNRSGRAENKHKGVGVWMHVRRKVKDILIQAKKENNITTARFYGNSAPKRRLYKKVTEKLAAETGAKRVTHDPHTGSTIHYE